MCSSDLCEQILSLGEGQAAEIWAPVVRGRRGSYRKELEGWRRQGFVRVQIDGETFDLAKPISLTRQARHDIDVVVDRLRVGTAARGRIRSEERRGGKECRSRGSPCP